MRVAARLCKEAISLGFDSLSLELSTVTIREITTDAPAYSQVWELRDAVLRRPLGLSLHDDDTSKDHLERIFIAEDETGRVIACVMLKPLPGMAFKLRQMAVASDVQGAGIGRQLVEAAERAAWEGGAQCIEMNARATALAFYEKLGYVVKGDAFSEVGIPHFFMKKVRPA